MTVSDQKSIYSEHLITMNDGVKIYARDYRPTQQKGPVCLILPGMTRNAKDGHMLAMNLVHHKSLPCRVISVDFRGRGKSDYADWTTYTIPREASDVADVMVALNIHKAVMIGTSRGGLVSMALGAMRPGLIAGVALNDIGPVLEKAGLARIASYVGVKPQLDTWDDAIQLTRNVNPGFNMSDTDWDEFTRRIYKDVNGAPRKDYDGDLALAFKALKPANGGDIPAFWHAFDTLKHVPLLVIRGEHSDILSQTVMRDMAIHHPDVDTLTVTDRGHAPFLDEPGVLPKIIKLCQASMV